MKTNKAFTVHTELIDGSLTGAKNIYMGANSTCHLYVIPREKIMLANTIQDIVGQPAFYILLGDFNVDKPKAYIGQTTDFSNRKNDHLQKKDWWKTALVFIADNHKIYGDDVKYLEYLGIETAISADSFELLNSANPKCPNIASYRISDMEVFFRDILFLCRFQGCLIFDEQPKPSHPQNYFYVKACGRPAEGKGYFDEERKKFILSKGTRLAFKVVNSFKSQDFRNKIIEKYCITNKDEIILQKDIEIDSPSSASSLVLGRPSNGWLDWKTESGQKLADIVTRKE